jgi:hypothetical protein
MKAMKAIPNAVVFFRLAGMLVGCWAGPPLVCRYLGPAAGALATVGAAVLWYSQYRLPTWKERGAASFWFVASGYGVIGVFLLICLGRLLR